MAHHRENTPDHRVIRVTRQDSPVADLADLEAWEARERYPELRLRGPLFAIGHRRDDGLWQIVILDEGNPQDARNSWNWRLRDQAAGTADAMERDACLAAAERLEWEPLNEMTVLGRDHRVIRGDLFLRFGTDGPEPPRPTDPDPVPAEGEREPRPRAEGFVIDPGAGTGMAEGLLKAELTTFAYSPQVVPPEVYADSVRARRTHPGVVLLPAVYGVAECGAEGKWSPITGICPTPHSAREFLVHYLRNFAPRLRTMADGDRAAYARAAERLARERVNETAAAGHRFRVVRTEALVRVGPDGPELPRASDWVPSPPPAVHEQQLREQGLWDEEG
ncbi:MULTISPECIES: DUF5954 family protein [Streptomycetaceae]|nr:MULTISPECIES: DUF5954 family protein [Streptomycetaceae]MYS57200.1 hypothetical protein [Streptomyces sp. SID5468]CCB72754.1 conserved protein of unknown function [Streptantibioticus cattleyicolor NRRL 8057 = DSM 46488]